MATVLMDLSKAFDCIPHDFLASDLLNHDLHAYGLSEDAVTFVASYLKRRELGVKINDTENVFLILLYNNVLYQTQFYSIILTNDLFFFI